MLLLEREAQLEMLSGALADVAAGSGRLVMVAGEAGAGKSALVRKFCDSVASTTPSLWGACDPLTAPRPLGPLVDISDQLGGDVVELLSTGTREGVFQATLTALTRRRPVIVVFEDVQWADESTLDLIRFLGRRIGKSRALMLTTYRDDQVDSGNRIRVLAGDLASAPAVGRISVSNLSQTSVTALSRGTGIDSVQLYRDTAGNAFFVTEVISNESSALPPTIADAVMARVARLSDPARRTLEAAAVVGRRIEPALLLSMQSADAAGLDECVSDGILRFEPPHYTFRHELARQALLESLSPRRRSGLHAEALGMLRQWPLKAELLPRLADHAEAAADTVAVLEFAPAAAEVAARFKSHREAAAQYARALRFAGDVPSDQRAELLERRSYECYLIDHVSDAIAAMKEALEIWGGLARPLRAGDCLRALSRLHWVSGHNAEAEATAQAAVEILEGLPPGVELARAFSNQSQLGMLAGDFERATRWGDRAIRLADELGNAAVIVHALNNVGTARLSAGDAAGEDLLVQSLCLALEAKLEDDAARAYTNLAATLTAPPARGRARRYLAEGIEYCSEHDLYASGLCLRAAEAEFLCDEGLWKEAEKAAVSLLVERRLSRISRIGALVVLARVRSRRGEPDVWPTLEEARALAVRTNEVQFLAPVSGARAEARWLSGSNDLLADELRTVLALAVSVGDSRAIGELAFWLWRAGEITAIPAGAAEQYAKHIRGDWKDAAAKWHELGFPYEAAIAMADSPDESDLRAAMTTLERLGARPAVARVARKLRALGAVKIPRGARPQTRANARGLTQRELEVLSMLEQGLRNAEIASRLCIAGKTVDHHVSSILSKLEVHTRSEAARKARELVLSPS
jgi:DNA-binding CsgD family transcriptional regulator